MRITERAKGDVLPMKQPVITHTDQRGAGGQVILTKPCYNVQALEALLSGLD